mgnify:CR=1 FL=1
MILLDVLASNPKLEGFINSLIEQGSHLGWTIIKAIIVFVVGRFIIRMINKLVRRILTKRDFDPSVKTFVGSLVNVTLMILLIISVVGALGVQTTSFAALLASAGVAIGMALSGNLSNFAGGLIILLFKPYKVGDYIESQGVGGTVREIQIFNTILATPDNKIIIIPNGGLSTGLMKNYSREATRRVDWEFGIAYGDDYTKARAVIARLLDADGRVLKDPAYFIALTSLGESSVNIVVRAWVNAGDYWGVYFDMNEKVYKTFAEENLNIPFPQLDVHLHGKTE